MATIGERQIAQSKRVKLIKHYLNEAKQLIDVEALEHTLEAIANRNIPPEYKEMIELCVRIGKMDFESDLPKINHNG